MRRRNKVPSKSPSKYNPSSKMRQDQDSETDADTSSQKKTFSGIEQTTAEKEWFDFSKNEIITAEKIIKSTFANPNRKKFPKKFKNETLYDVCDDVNFFIESIQEFLAKRA